MLCLQGIIIEEFPPSVSFLHIMSFLFTSVPGQPSKFQIGAVSDTSIELTWEPAHEKEGIDHKL